MRDAEPTIELLVAVMEVVPLVRAVANPAVPESLLTVATDEVPELQTTDVVKS